MGVPPLSVYIILWDFKPLAYYLTIRVCDNVHYDKSGPSNINDLAVCDVVHGVSGAVLTITHEYYLLKNKQSESFISLTPSALQLFNVFNE